MMAQADEDGKDVKLVEGGEVPSPDNDPEKAREVGRKVAGWTRFIAGVPAVGLFICSVVLAVEILIDVVMTTVGVVGEGALAAELAISYVEYADLFLLAVALYILSLGLFSLFVTDKIPLPRWLEFHDFDDLKERLVGVIVVMLAVYYLGLVLEGETGIEMLWLGLAIAAIIVSLAVFVKHVFKAGE
jgi:uncharacterized membrane protein YqhA